MSNSTSSDRTKDAEERVKRGYEKATGKKPSPHDLELLTTKQIKHFYKAGSNKQRSKKRTLIYSALLLVTVLAGILAYQYFKQANEDYDPSKSTGFLESDTSFSVKKKPGTDDLASPSPSPSPSQSTNSDRTRTSQAPQTTGNSYSSATLISCIPKTIPYKTYIKRGTIGPFKGYDGLEQTCTYSDGKSFTERLMRPTDEYIYLNVSSADYATAYNICSNVRENPTAAMISDCMAIVWTPNE